MLLLLETWLLPDNSELLGKDADVNRDDSEVIRGLFHFSRREI
jgi:hypothetical protein